MRRCTLILFLFALVVPLTTGCSLVNAKQIRRVSCDGACAVDTLKCRQNCTKQADPANCNKACSVNRLDCIGKCYKEIDNVGKVSWSNKPTGKTLSQQHSNGLKIGTTKQTSHWCMRNDQALCLTMDAHPRSLLATITAPLHSGRIDPFSGLTQPSTVSRSSDPSPKSTMSKSPAWARCFGSWRTHSKNWEWKTRSRWSNGDTSRRSQEPITWMALLKPQWNWDGLAALQRMSKRSSLATLRVSRKMERSITGALHGTNRTTGPKTGPRSWLSWVPRRAPARMLVRWDWKIETRHGKVVAG